MSRINIFTGANGSGKTSINEALFLLLSSDIKFLLDASIVRSQSVNVVNYSAAYDALWKPLYSNLDASKPIRVSAHDTLLGRIKAELLSAQSMTVVHQSSQESLLSDGSESLNLKIYGEGSLIRESKLESSGQRVTSTTGPLLNKEGNKEWMKCAVIRTVSSPDSDAERLADLKLKKLDGRVVEALKIMLPRLSSLEPMSIGGRLMIWADLDDLPELVPLPVLGEGVVRLTHLAMALLHVQDGVMIVDEVGNGLHYSKLKEM